MCGSRALISFLQVTRVTYPFYGRCCHCPTEYVSTIDQKVFLQASYGFIQAHSQSSQMEDVQLLLPANNPPLSIIAAAKVFGVNVTVDTSASSPTLLFSGRKLEGTNSILRYLSRVTGPPNFFGCKAFETVQIDEWLEFACVLSGGSTFENACQYIDKYLEKNTVLVGDHLSVADITIWAALAGTRKRWQSLRRSVKYQNLVRWFDSVSAECSCALNEVTEKYLGMRYGMGKALTTENGDASKNLDAGSHVDLPDADKFEEVCLRFAPEPSGYLHLGHAKAALMNDYFAKRYKGRLIIRFDDTNPSKENNEFVISILEDIKTLGISYKEVTYTSDYFPKLMKMAEDLIQKGKAYVDDTLKLQMKEERKKGIASRCRNNSVEDNLDLWNAMVDGSERGLKCCLRGKLDMQHPNKSLRDPVYYRCQKVPHHRNGSEYNIYPTYDFACPFVDSEEGITHALRASEYHDRNAQYHRIQEDMGVRKVHIYEFSRLNMVYTTLSKRHLRRFVESGKVDGWDDPRFPTIKGLVRRGLESDALVQFIMEQGASKNLNLMEWDKLWSNNKKIIDPVCPRHTAILEKQCVLLTLTNGPDKPFVQIIPKHKKYEGAGHKATVHTKRIWVEHADAGCISEGEEITLMDWGNAIVREIKRDSNGDVMELRGELHLGGSVKATKLKLTWLPESAELIKLLLVEFDHLLTKDKLDKKQDKDPLDFARPCTRRYTAAIGDANMRNLKRGEIIQLERKGYYRCDVPFFRASEQVVLFAIPDGRQQKKLS